MSTLSNVKATVRNLYNAQHAGTRAHVAFIEYYKDWPPEPGTMPDALRTFVLPPRSGRVPKGYATMDDYMRHVKDVEVPAEVKKRYGKRMQCEPLDVQPGSGRRPARKPRRRA